MIHKKIRPLNIALTVLLSFSMIFIEKPDAISRDVKKEISEQGKLDSFVLVRRSAQFFDHIPRASSAPKRSKWTRKEQKLNQAFVARVLRLTPNWAKIAIGQQSSKEHCLSGHPQGKFFYLEVYVDRTDLIPVVKTKTTQQFSDGTEIMLWPGLPLFEQSTSSKSFSTYKVQASHFSFTVTLNLNRVGLSWRKIKLNPKSLPHFEINQATTLQLDEKANIPVDHTDELVLVDLIAQVRQRALVQFDETCLRIKALVAKDMVKKADYVVGIGTGGMGLGGTGYGWSSRSKYTLKKGVKLKWQNGQPAGHILKDYIVGQGQIVANANQQVCFKVRMAPAWDNAKQSQPIVVCYRQDRDKINIKN